MNSTKAIAAALTMSCVFLAIFAAAGVAWAAAGFAVIAGVELVAIILAVRGSGHA